MHTSICVVLSLAFIFGGIFGVGLRGSTAVILKCQNQRQVFDPDDGAGRSFEQDKPRIDRFARAIKEDPFADAYIIAYGGLVSYKKEARIRLDCTRRYLMATHGISGARIKLIDGGYMVETAVQLLLVKPGDPKPTAFPTVNREAVRLTKAPKYPCGKSQEGLRKTANQ